MDTQWPISCQEDFKSEKDLENIIFNECDLCKGLSTLDSTSFTICVKAQETRSGGLCGVTKGFASGGAIVVLVDQEVLLHLQAIGLVYRSFIPNLPFTDRCYQFNNTYIYIIIFWYRNWKKKTILIYIYTVYIFVSPENPGHEWKAAFQKSLYLFLFEWEDSKSQT